MNAWFACIDERFRVVSETEKKNSRYLYLLSIDGVKGDKAQQHSHITDWDHTAKGLLIPKLFW
jgi:hypothetical protein